MGVGLARISGPSSPFLLDYGLSEGLSPISLPSPQGGGWVRWLWLLGAPTLTAHLWLSIQSQLPSALRRQQFDGNYECVKGIIFPVFHTTDP
ncbi:MAG: hypothetical protein JWP26_3952 [Devosia sp.]|nr:hypothetical protein [Devosia sp.]